jgi:hypothetical protein
MYLLVSQHISDIIMPIIRRTVQSLHHRRCRVCTVLLMMGMMMPETCWDTNKYIICSASGWLFIHLHDSRCTVTWNQNFLHYYLQKIPKLLSDREYVWLFRPTVFLHSTDKKMIPAEKAIVRMRKISWPMKSCYYPPWQHSHSAVAHSTLPEMLYVFSLCVVAGP